MAWVAPAAVCHRLPPLELEHGSPCARPWDERATGAHPPPPPKQRANPQARSSRLRATQQLLCWVDFRLPGSGRSVGGRRSNKRPFPSCMRWQRCLFFFFFFYLSLPELGPTDATTYSAQLTCSRFQASLQPLNLRRQDTKICLRPGRGVKTGI